MLKGLELTQMLCYVKQQNRETFQEHKGNITRFPKFTIFR